jgi:tetratricopeptide (TPR) repeat protein
MDPKFHISFLNLAMVDLLENDTNSALEKISQAEAITTSCPYLFFIKGLCFIQKKDIESAIRTIQQAIKICASDGIFFIALGDLFYEQHQIELANTYWKKSNQSYEYLHWDQQRHRSKHFDQITTDYWVSPELLSLR